MRILLFSTAFYPHVGGAEVAIENIANRLPNVDFIIITARYDRVFSRCEQVDNIEVHRVTPGWGCIDKWLLPFFGVVHALRLHRKNPFDINHAVMATYGGQAASWFKRLVPPVPMVLTLQEGQSPQKLRRRSWWFRSTYKNIFRRADHITVISSFLGEYARSIVPDVPQTLIPNGVDFRRFATEQEESKPHSFARGFGSTKKRAALRTIDPDAPIGAASRVIDPDVSIGTGRKSGTSSVRERLGVSTDAFVVTTASRLEPKNGVDTLIEAVNLVNNSRELFTSNREVLVVVAGDGSLRDQLQQQVEQLGIADSVQFLGTVPHSELPGILHASDVFVRLSRSEGLGIAFLEAMAAGVPVVATPVGGIPDFLNDDVTGLSVPPDDPKAAAEALVRLQKDDALRETLITNARRMVQDRYDWDIIARQYGELYESLLAESAASIVVEAPKYARE